LRLADLVDVEVQLARDREGDPSALETRDRALAGGVDPARPHAALARWVAALRAAPGAALPGRAIARAVRVVRAALVLAGLAAGWGAAAALTRFEGPHPVNVWDWLLAFVGVPLALLALLLLSLVPPVRALGLPLLGAVRGALGAALLRIAGGRWRAAGWAEIAHRLRARRSLYRDVEPWLLVGLSQSFAVAFYLGVVLATLRQVVFSDVAFAWSTTLLRLDTGAFHDLVRGLAAPWAWLWPEAVPSRALVAATRYSHLESAYFESGAGRAADPALVGAWWPFLVAAVIAYGLLPRLAMLVLARARAAWLLARLPLDDADVQSLLRRIAAPAVRTGATTAEAPEPVVPPAGAAAGPLAGPAGRSALVLWRDVPHAPGVDAAVVRRTGARIDAVYSAGGRDAGEDAVDWRRAAEGLDSVVVLAEAWEAPDRGALRLLGRLREALGPRRHVVVLLAGAGNGAPAPADVRNWREGLSRLEDPWLAVDALPEAS
jgi:hypothetical protein